MDIKSIEKFLKIKYGIADFSTEKLAGDASDREFYRIIFPAPVIGGKRTAVLMALGSPWKDGELPYMNVRTFMEKIGLPVPALYHADLAAGFILIEDFGDLTLEEAVRKAPPGRVEELYKSAVDLMLEIQAGGTRARDDSCVSFSLSFDVEKLMFEFNFFYEHAVIGYKGGGAAPGDESLIRNGFLAVSETLASEPRFLNHRDYHSRNLMVKADGKLALVDFQDARLGPLQYDLVSLLFDSYVTLPEELTGSLYEYYIGKLEKDYGLPRDRERFDRIYDYMTVQRCIKAAGSFAYLDCVKKKNRYLQYFKPCLSHVRPAVERRPELTPFYEALSRYVEELRNE
jgi:hypothetical protein